MIDLLYGTGNQAKLDAMRKRTEGLGIHIIGLQDMKEVPPKVPEDGQTLLDNARKKALAYYRFYGIPVFSCDSGLYIENIPEELQPGIHVRNVNGKCLTDDEMLAYYTGLAKKYGNLRARYRNAICLVAGEGKIFERMDESLASEMFLMTDKPHSPVRHRGFPLDSISIDIKTGKYYYDMDEEKLNKVAVEDGFTEFFRCVSSAFEQEV